MGGLGLASDDSSWAHLRRATNKEETVSTAWRSSQIFQRSVVRPASTLPWVVRHLSPILFGWLRDEGEQRKGKERRRRKKKSKLCPKAMSKQPTKRPSTAVPVSFVCRKILQTSDVFLAGCWIVETIARSHSLGRRGGVNRSTNAWQGGWSIVFLSEFTAPINLWFEVLQLPLRSSLRLEAARLETGPSPEQRE